MEHQGDFQGDCEQDRGPEEGLAGARRGMASIGFVGEEMGVGMLFD